MTLAWLVWWFFLGTPPVGLDLWLITLLVCVALDLATSTAFLRRDAKHPPLIHGFGHTYEAETRGRDGT
jgi:hypothetical protein